MEASGNASVRKQKKEDLFQKRLRLIYDTVLEARDPDDKEKDLVSIFMKLPSKKEYPDYYQVGAMTSNGKWGVVANGSSGK